MELFNGRIYIISGPNGCGKTMLLRALSGLISVDSGNIYLDNKKLKQDFSVLPELGIVLENVGLFSNLTGYQNLEYLARMRNRIGKEEIISAMKRVGLDPNDNRTYNKYSLGMKQRLAIAQAIMEQPDIIMLDEPTNSLDCDGMSLVRKLILEEKERGAMIIITTHNDEDIRLLGDSIFKMENGRIISLCEVRNEV